jgi:hypothetical protein
MSISLTIPPLAASERAIEYMPLLYSSPFIATESSRVHVKVPVAWGMYMSLAFKVALGFALAG